MSVLPLWKLDFLKYPRAGNFSVTDADEVVALVAFLEDRHVRLWPIEKRAPLRKAGPEWPATFAAYMQASSPAIVGMRLAPQSFEERRELCRRHHPPRFAAAAAAAATPDFPAPVCAGR